ncbi:YjcZ family sporulation protein [Paenibacillus sp. FSL W7-1279]|nr:MULTISPECIES: YjcZ family sporulation protein [Paenibacillus]MBX4147392.1 YjcZ family sporulation protein [Paenibacillus lautus]MCT1399229.1 YjcZ family sporulation protein [Paenibacillus sp. p3-SID867]
MSGVYGGGEYGNSVGIILVLFILLVIILSAWV